MISYLVIVALLVFPLCQLADAQAATKGPGRHPINNVCPGDKNNYEEAFCPPGTTCVPTAGGELYLCCDAGDNVCRNGVCVAEDGRRLQLCPNGTACAWKDSGHDYPSYQSGYSRNAFNDYGCYAKGIPRPSLPRGGRR